MAESEESPAFMVDEADGRSEDGDEVDGGEYGDSGDGSEGDELDPETMEAIASGNLPVSIEAATAMNLVYQELLQAFVRHVEASLAQNREKQRSLEEELRTYSGEGGAKKRDSKFPVTMYIPPYFRDSAGLAPVKNDDAVKKEGELDMLVKPPRRWTEPEKRTLRASVEKAIVQRQATPLTNKKHFLLEELKVTTEAADLESKLKQIKELDKKIDAIRSKLDFSTIPAKTFEQIDWTQISVAEFQGTRTAVECRQFWFRELNPSINQNTNWTSDELGRLLQIAREHEYRDWKAIADELNTGRTSFQCFEKFKMDEIRRSSRRKWSEEEDTKLSEAVHLYRQGDYIPWEQVADMIEGRTRAQCSVRWLRTVQPGLKRGQWTDEEDLLLLGAVSKLGAKDWVKVAELVPGRTDNQCRERYSTTMVVDQRHGAWTAEEDAMLLQGMQQFGTGNWTRISQLMHGRSAMSCKTRYHTMRRQIKETGNVRELTFSEICAANARAEKVAEKRNRVVAMYTRIVGQPPVLKGGQPDSEQVLLQLPEPIRAMFRQKLSGVIHASGLPTAGRNCATLTSRRAKRAPYRYRLGGYKDQFHRILQDVEGQTPPKIRKSANPTKDLSELVNISRAIIPPTECTIQGLRNLLSWHGAGWLVDAKKATATANDPGSSTATNEVDNPGTSGSGGNANGSGETQMSSTGIIPPNMDESTTDSWIIARDLFRQLFQWPAIMAMLEDPQVEGST